MRKQQPPDHGDGPSVKETCSGIEIRTAGVASAELLAALHNASFTQSAVDPWSVASARALLTTPGIVALIAAGPAAGAGVAQPCGLAVARTGPGGAEILALGVLPQVQRRGIASSLLTALLRFLAAANVRDILLDVAVDNHPARALYAAHGFLEVALRRNYYRRLPGPAIDALVLARPVAPLARTMRGPDGIADGQQSR